ncbi:sulfatase-like hydrolase/transferase [Clostridium tarantellae]|uniref:Sulfatase-like hydrolase/transferase n=1 Tax=Clostridium tarantellae TaxID=39493 RepID=A0A6I1MM30_9CLOT|nr:sulfatase-like hydrolase/transferase [Clostridium tarantellae]
MNKKTNVLFIITDDQGYWSLGSYGNKDAITPNLDNLANNGIRFDNFFCVSPVCSPARATIYTGRIPSQHGIHDWLNDWSTGGVQTQYLNWKSVSSECSNVFEWNNVKPTEEYLKGQSTFVDVLANNGYNCAFSGKWHLGASQKPQKGFKHWYCHQKGGGPYYNAPMFKDGNLIKVKEYITDSITDYGLEFLENQKNSNEPFFLNLNYTAPHDPWDSSNHPKDLLDLYNNSEFNSCPIEENHPWKIHWTFNGNNEQRKEVLKGYFASITSVDNNIKRVLDKLKELGELENTLIIYTSDNGMNMGHHGIYGKGNGTSPVNMYDTSVKVPFFVTKFGDIKPRVCSDLLSHYDIRHTLLDYLNLEDSIEDDIDLPGKSFADILRNKDLEVNEDIVVYDEYGPTRMIRTKEFKLIHRYPAGPHELYDLVNDPNEKVNLINDSSKKTVIQKLRKDLKSWFIKYVNPEIDGATLPVFGGGQIGFAGLWGDGQGLFKKYNTNFIFSGDGKLKN